MVGMLAALIAYALFLTEIAAYTLIALTSTSGQSPFLDVEMPDALSAKALLTSTAEHTCMKKRPNGPS